MAVATPPYFFRVFYGLDYTVREETGRYCLNAPSIRVEQICLHVSPTGVSHSITQHIVSSVHLFHTTLSIVMLKLA